MRQKCTFLCISKRVGPQGLSTIVSLNINNPRSDELETSKDLIKTISAT